MLSSSTPPLFPLTWAASAGAGYIRTIPTASQIGITAGAASLTDGFPPLNFLPVSGGGVPPFGQDMNGILHMLSAGVQWEQVGGEPVYNASLQTAIGGYPAGAILQSADGTGWWRSTTENNLTNPETGGAGWVPVSFYGAALVSLSNANVTLSLAQYAKPFIILSGTLTANVQLIFPALYENWLVVNNTTGAYNITAKTAAGTGVVLSAGPNMLYCDSTNINFSSAQLPATLAYLNLNQTFTKAQRSAVTTLTDGASINVDFSLSNDFTVTLGGNRTLTFTNAVAGQSGTIVVNQDGTGGRTLAYTGFKFYGGVAPTLTMTASAVDHLHYKIGPGGLVTLTIGRDSK